MNWRRAIITAVSLVLAAVLTYPFPAWASATTGVTIVAAEEESSAAEGQPTEEKGGEANGENNLSTAPSNGLFPKTGDAAGVVFALILSVAVGAAIIAVRLRVRAKERFRMHEINAHAMRGIGQQPHARRRKP